MCRDLQTAARLEDAVKWFDHKPPTFPQAVRIGCNRAWGTPWHLALLATKYGLPLESFRELCHEQQSSATLADAVK